MPRRIRRGKRARLRLTLSGQKIVVQRRVHGHRIHVRTLKLDAPAGRVSIRLPGRVHGHALERGRYRVSVVVIDAAGNRSATVRRPLRVRKRAADRRLASHAIRPLKSVTPSPRVVQLVDGSHGAGLNALSRTLFVALDRRDRAIEDIRVLAPPAPRSEDIARVRARKRQEEDEVVTFDTVMPTTIAQSTTSSRPSPARSPTRRT